MRKLRFTVVLPLVHIATFLALFGWHLFSYREMNLAIQMWCAVNAPVFVLPSISVSGRPESLQFALISCQALAPFI
jgi:uncharacterized protein with PQ loop repeat